MITCFIFAKHMDDQSVLSVTVDAAGQVRDALARRSGDELKALGPKTTILVLPAAMCSLYTVTLPPLGTDARQLAIGYALEEEVAQPIDQLQFVSFQSEQQLGWQTWLSKAMSMLFKSKQKTTAETVAVFERTVLAEVTTQVHAFGCDIQHVVLDWSALSPGESCITDTDCLVNHNDYRGSLDEATLSRYLQKPATFQPFVFKDSINVELQKKQDLSPAKSAEWMAKRLLQASPLDLPSQYYRQERQQETSQKWTWYGLYVVLGWIGVVLLFSILKFGYLSIAIHYEQRSVQRLFHELFPNGSDVKEADLKTRRLLQMETYGHRHIFWQLMGRVTQASEKHNVSIEGIHFKGDRMRITVRYRDVKALRGFQRSLQGVLLKVIRLQTNINGSKDMAIFDIGIVR